LLSKHHFTTIAKIDIQSTIHFKNTHATGNRHSRCEINKLSLLFSFSARIMTKKFLLPFLLGLKFNLATLLPIILGLIIFISKKAAFLSKIALFISGMFGLGGIYSLGALGGGGDFGHGNFGGGYGYQHQPPLYHDSLHQPVGVYKILESNTPRSHNEAHSDDHFYDFDQKQLLKDRASRLYEREVDREKLDKFAAAANHQRSTSSTNQRNFVWQTAINQN